MCDGRLARRYWFSRGFRLCRGQPGLDPDLGLDFVSQLKVVFEERLGILAALADARHMSPQALANWLAKYTR